MSALYKGDVYHARFKVEGVSSASHQFRYPLFMALVDLDEVKTGRLFANIPMASLERRNIISFYRKGMFKLLLITLSPRSL